MRKRPTRRSMAPWLTVLVAATLWCAAADAMAQTPYMPYYGKNLVRYDRFDWQIYKTEHFQIYYYPEIEQHLGVVVRDADEVRVLAEGDILLDGHPRSGRRALRVGHGWPPH